MEKTRSNRRGIGCVSAFLLFLFFIFANLSYLSYALTLPSYTSHISQFMVQQKRTSGKWPANLDRFSHSFKSSRSAALVFHRSYFQRMEILQSDDKRCRFRLHLRGFWDFYPRPSIVEEDEATIK